MKIPTCLLPILALGLLVAGCATPESRIKKNPEVFNSLPPEQQQAVQEGRIDIGFTKDAVFLALGKPHREYIRTTEVATVVVWSWVDYDYYTDRQQVTGRFHVRDSKGRSRSVHDTVWVDVRQEREYERLRVEFHDDVVIAIERVSER